jgi:hypothetical protein
VFTFVLGTYVSGDLIDSVDVGQLVEVAVFIHSLFPVEVKAIRSFIHSVHYAIAPVEVSLSCLSLS